MSDIKTNRKVKGESGIRPKVDPTRWRVQDPDQKVYRCKVILRAEDDKAYSIYAATLPGVASQGDTEEEAINNIIEALEGVLASYKAQGQDVPWAKETESLPRGAQVRWVVVHG